jgi:iron complex transport system substrate-binding protein
MKASSDPAAVRLSSRMVAILAVVCGGGLMVGGCREAGRTASSQHQPRRIVSTSPAATEILFALGVGSRVVGNTRYCDYPTEAAAVAKVGDVLADSISTEAVLELKPDLVVTDASLQPTLADRFQKVGLNVVALRVDSIDALKLEIDRMANNLGISPTGLLDRLSEKEQAVARRVGDRKRPTVFIHLGEPTLYTVGAGTVVSEIVTAAGGRNIFDDTPKPYLNISNEELVKRDPDVIVVTHSKDVAAFKKDMMTKPGFASLRAVKAGRVYFVSPDTLSRPGPRYVDAMTELADLFHPKAP